MENSTTAIASKPKPRRSRISKAFWGLIGLMAIVSIGLISMAVVSMNKYTYATENTQKPKDPDVEIMSLGGGEGKVIAGNTLPANPIGVDESVVDSGTSGKTAETAVEQKAVGTALVDKVAVKPVTAPKKQQVAVAAVSEDKPKSKSNASVNKQEKVTVQHKESNKQMDNLF